MKILSSKLVLALGAFSLLALACASCAFANTTTRKSDHPIMPLLLQRQSKYSLARTMNNEQMKSKLSSIFEAARWAPSSYNNQTTRYIYGYYGTRSWNRLFNVLVPFNQDWVRNAGALILVVSRTKSDHNDQPAPTHSFDAGLASMQLILQATSMGLVAHPMSGYDEKAARKEFSVPEDCTIEAMIAIGEPAPADKANKEFAERDAKQSTRKTIKEIASEGKLPKN